MQYVHIKLFSTAFVACAILAPGISLAQTASTTDTALASTTLTLASSTASTTPVSATTTRINILLSQIDILKRQLSALVQEVMSLGGIGTSTPAIGGVAQISVPPTTTCTQFDRALGIGMKGTDIKELQQIIYENDPVFPKSAISGFFGAVTKSALMRFQVKFGITSPTGFMGPLTRDYINQECANGGQPQGVIPRMMLPGMIH
jgi:peptidoglycan hydrolase-like protein with peptidoglycan-binding domain